MRKLLQIISILVFSISILAQTEEQKTVLVDEFGELNSETLSVRIENFRTELQNNPNSKGYVIIYRDKTLPVGFSIRYQVKIQNYLTENLGVSQARFEFINGGLAVEKNTQLWISMDGSRPSIKNSLSEEPEPNKTFLFDEFPYPGKNDVGGCCAIDGYTEEAKKASLDKFAQKLKNQPLNKGYIILYGQNCTDCSESAVYSKNGKYLGTKSNIYLDFKTEITKSLLKEKTYLLKNYGIKSSRIIAINGGYKEWRTMELWIVPKEGEIPKPKPDYFPKKK